MRRKMMMSLAGAVSLIAPLVLTSATFAWGPERPTYTNEHPADHAVFNSITNNAAVGDERDFVRIEEKNSGRPYTSAIEVEAGKQYEVYIYYHNDASKTYNDNIDSAYSPWFYETALVQCVKALEDCLCDFNLTVSIVA